MLRRGWKAVAHSSLSKRNSGSEKTRKHKKKSGTLKRTLVHDPGLHRASIKEHQLQGNCDRVVWRRRRRHASGSEREPLQTGCNLDTRVVEGTPRKKENENFLEGVNLSFGGQVGDSRSTCASRASCCNRMHSREACRLRPAQ